MPFWKGGWKLSRGGLETLKGGLETLEGGGGQWLPVLTSWPGPGDKEVGGGWRLTPGCAQGDAGLGPVQGRAVTPSDVGPRVRRECTRAMVVLCHCRVSLALSGRDAMAALCVTSSLSDIIARSVPRALGARGCEGQ
jgi:hypothetical protein